MLGVHDMKTPSMYSCTSAEIVYTLNDLPTANLVIGQGSPLSQSDTTAAYTNGQLQDLLDDSRELRKAGTTAEDYTATKMLRCTLYEADAKSTKLNAVFRGWIVSVQGVQRAGNMTVKALRVQCMGLAAVLHVAPVAGYRRTSGAILVNAAASGREIPKNNGASNAGVDPFSVIANTSDAAIVARYNDYLVDKDVLTRIAYLANIITQMHEARAAETNYEEFAADDSILHIKRYIYCNWKPQVPELTQNGYNHNNDLGIYQLNTSNSFSLFLCGQLLQMLQQSSILMTIGAICTGTDVMMNLVPHFKLGGDANSFRMELKPSEAWNAVNVIEIPDNYVTGFNSALNHLEHLSDPQAIVVNFSRGVVAMDPVSRDGIPSGCFGVYSPIKEIQEWAKYRYADPANKEELKQQTSQQMFKTQYFRAPYWLDWDYLSNKHTDSIYYRQPLGSQDNTGTVPSAEEINMLKAAELADYIAKALYAFLHGSSDTGVFDLTPDIRFGLDKEIGCLEDHIGSIVDICGYRGMLQSVKYSYNSGKVTTGSYSISLSSLRPVDKNEPRLECPLYALAGNSKKYDELYNADNLDATQEGKYWKDEWEYKPRG